MPFAKPITLYKKYHRMKSQIILIVSILFLGQLLTAQNSELRFQTIKGVVIDKDTKQALIGATVQVLNIDQTIGTVTDFDGSYTLENVPLGRNRIECSYVGYGTFQSEAFILNSAKERVIDIELIESGITTEEVVVKAYNNGSDAVNDLSILSTRSFTVEETQRYAASANDPGRMVQAFPGVQPSRDTRSDIVIRGNSSVGILWRLEGVDIPNPNHFARRGSSGGGITIFSTSMLGKSDFSTGAFPAEYGNSFSGVFDMKFRKGNRENRESTFKAGLLGLDFSTEGPIKKGKSSYLLNYRYSTLGILNSMGIHLVSPRVDNTFQDLSFKLDFASENNKSFIGLWGIGGLSKEIKSAVENVEDWKSYSDQTGYEFITNMGAMGLNHTYLIDDKSYIKTTLAVMGQEILVADDTASVEKVLTVNNTEDFKNSRISLSSNYSRKLNLNLTFKSGLTLSQLHYNLKHDLNLRNVNLLDEKGNAFLVQPFAQMKFRPNPRWTINFGVHGMLFTLNNSYNVEPRLGIQNKLNENNTISLAYGLHSRILPLGTYFSNFTDFQGNIVVDNMDLELIKSHHFVLGYDLKFKNNMKFHAEAYYQHLYDVPADFYATENFWMLNEIQGYSYRPLKSSGLGYNIGLDLSLEKYFENATYFLLNASVFDSKFRINEVRDWYNTQYNSNYSASFMGGREWTIGESGVLQTGIKLIFNGGLRITPLQENPSDVDQYNPPVDRNRPYEEQIPAYFRPDLRIAYRKDKQKYAWSLALDVQNFIGKQNIDGLNREYDPDLREWVYRKQSGLVPVLSYQIDF